LGNVGSISAFADKYRLYACRRKISPITGRKYSLLAKFEVARSASAPAHRRLTILGGLVAFQQLNIEAYPDPTPPMIESGAVTSEVVRAARCRRGAKPMMNVSST